MSDQETRDKIAKIARQRLAEKLMPAMSDPKNRIRTMVAIKVLSIVDKQIGKGQGPLDQEWQEVRDMVAAQPGATDLVDTLKATVRSYEEDLEAKISKGGVDEAAARAAAVTVIRVALLKNIKLVETKPPDAT